MSQHYPHYPPSQQYFPPPQQQYYPPPPPNAGAYSGGQYNQPPTYEHDYGQGRQHGQEHQYGQGHHYGQTSPVAEKWNPRPRFQDLWAVILFLIHFVGFLILSYIGIKEIIDRKNKNTPTVPDNNNQNGDNTIDIKFDSASITLLVLTGIFGFFLSLIYMFLIQKFPKPLIKITLYLSIAFYFIAAAVFAYLGQYVEAVILGIFAIIYLICAFSWRDRIPFAAILLETVTSVTKKYYGTIIMGFVGLIIQVAWSVWWVVSAIGAVDKFSVSSGCGAQGNSAVSCSSPIIYIVVLFLVFSFYWTSQVIKTIVHVTDSGVFASFYFLEGTSQGVGSVPTLSSLKRACTTSFGSICFGSLIIALLNTLRFILRSVARSDDGACGFLAACLECLLSWIEDLVQYFNRYAYVQVAIYGKSYCQSAKDTWKLIKDRGVEAIINDNLIGNVLSMGAIFIGALCALFGFGYIKLFVKNMANDSAMVLVLVLICFFLGFMMTIVITDAIDSGVATTFVALAEDPNALLRTKPVLFERIRREWPRVVQGM